MNGRRWEGFARSSEEVAQWEFRVRLYSRTKHVSSFGKSRSNDRWKQATSWGFGGWWIRYDFLGSWIAGRAVSCLWCLLPFFLALVTKFWISLWLTNCQKGCLWENGAERSLRLGNLPILAKHTEMCTPMMRWQDTANGAWVTWETRVQDQVQRIGTRSSVLARLWKTLGRLENQRVALQGHWFRDSWVTEVDLCDCRQIDLWICSRSSWHGNTMSWLSIGWWTTGWYNIVTYLPDKLWQIYVSKFGWVTDIHMVQMAKLWWSSSQKGVWKFPVSGEMNPFGSYTLMVSSTVMVDITFACPTWCSFYWRWRNPTTIWFSSPLPTLIAWRMRYRICGMKWKIDIFSISFVETMAENSFLTSSRWTVFYHMPMIQLELGSLVCLSMMKE